MLKVIFASLFCFAPAQALVLEDLIQEGTLEKTLSHKKVGYYVGSFDPLHLGHQDIALIPIQKGLVDYVLIMPNWGGDTYKNRTPIEERLNMIFAAFKDSPHVIVTKLSPQEMQSHLTKPDTSRVVFEKPVVRNVFEGTQFIGIIGSDTALKLAITHQDPQKEQERKKDVGVFMRGIKVPDKYAKSTAGGVIALPVDQFIIAQREGDDITSLGEKVEERSILATIQSPTYHHVSSTSVKKRLKEGQSVDDMLNPNVLKMIEENKLYPRN